MSYYYNYFLGYMKDNVIYPLGPYDHNGKFKSVLTKSRSFASDLHEDFYSVKDPMISNDLKELFTYVDYNKEIKVQKLKYLPLEDLGSDDFVITGYFLLDEINNYLKEKDAEDLLYDYLTPEAFAIKLQSELAFGKPEQKYDCEGEPFEMHPCSDYAYFSYPNIHSREYEVFLTRQTAEIFEFSEMPDGAQIVVIETEG